MNLLWAKVVIVISLAVFALASYLVWPSRKNVPAHLQVGFVSTAYVIPVFLTDLLERLPVDSVWLYVNILAVSAPFFAFGTVFGFFLPRLRLVSRGIGFETLSSRVKRPRFRHQMVWWALAALLATWVCFGLMGFIPFFADDPLSAKFFRGLYKVRYERVAFPYRLGYFVMLTITPILIAFWIERRRWPEGVLALACLGTLLLTLSRGPAVGGLLLVIGVVAVRKRWRFVAFLLFVLIIYPLGSTSYLIAGQLIGGGQLAGLYVGGNVWSHIASGAPDVSDQVLFLAAFSRWGELTWGQTFWGGLIPGNFPWNPSIWTLTVLNHSSDVSQIASGGLRLPVALWGYTSFGWLGVVWLSLMSGLIGGTAIRFAAHQVGRGGVLNDTLILLFYQGVSGQLAGFYVLSMYTLPIALVLISLIYGFRFLPRIRRTQQPPLDRIEVKV